MFSEFCSISALLCSFEFVWVWVWVGVGGWWYSQRLLSLNPTTVMVVLLLGLWLLLGCDNKSLHLDINFLFYFLIKLNSQLPSNVSQFQFRWAEILDSRLKSGSKLIQGFVAAPVRCIFDYSCSLRRSTSFVFTVLLYNLLFHPTSE